MSFFNKLIISILLKVIVSILLLVVINSSSLSRPIYSVECYEDCVCEYEGDPDCYGGAPCSLCGSSPGNVCCTPGNSDPICGGHPDWTFAYSPECVLVNPDPRDPRCEFEWSYQLCSAVDSCQGGNGLKPGLCTSGGCAIGSSMYKTCCNGSYSAPCSGGDYSGICSPYDTVWGSGIDEDCSGSVPTVTPGGPPTATPTPGVPPGGCEHWGACGGCSGCGIDPECVKHYFYDCSGWECVWDPSTCNRPVATPTPTPLPKIHVNTYDPEGNTVTMSNICKTSCNVAVNSCIHSPCFSNVTQMDVWRGANDGNYTGGKISLTDSSGKQMILLGVTPVPSANGNNYPTCLNNNDGYCYAWSDYWSTGTRTVNFIVAAPTPYPTVVIQGGLREYTGSAAPLCQDLGISTLAQPTIRLLPANPTGIQSNCTTSPGTSPYQTYQCTISYDNQNWTVNPNQNFQLNVTNFDPYNNYYWVSAGACVSSGSTSINVNVTGPSITPGPQPYQQGILFSLTDSWIKLKNTSFLGNGVLTNVIPLFLSAYDSDDDAGQRYFIVNTTGSDPNDPLKEPGVVASNSVDTGTAEPSSKNWSAGEYSKYSNFAYSNLLEYIKARKQYRTIADPVGLTDLDQGDGIYLYVGDLTISDTNKTKFNNKKILLVVTGTLTFTAGDFKPTNASTAINANILNFYSDSPVRTRVSEAWGLFLTNIVNTGDSTDQGLKIKGNLIVRTGPFTNNRQWADNSKPSVFIVFDLKKYMDLYPYLTTSTYEWKQLQ